MRLDGSGWRGCGWRLLLWLAALVCVTGLAGAQTALTAVQDTVTHADGTPATGSVIVSWPAFTTAAGQTIASGTLGVTLGAGGSFNTSLASNAGATPMGTYYTAVYHLDDGSTSREFWVVPSSSTPVKLSSLRASVLPTSVAMQTVTKQYVDNAIVSAALGTLPQTTINPYVLKTGDTMTGPLVLPGAPTSSLQAADKAYVDQGIASLQAGMGQKVSTIPVSTQVVMQPSGTQLQTNLLNGNLYATPFLDQVKNDGITNAFASPDCAGGCSVVAERTYSGVDGFLPRVDGTALHDLRSGGVADSYFNPGASFATETALGQSVNVTESTDAAAWAAAGHGSLTSVGLAVEEQQLGGGDNTFPQNITGTVPYFKSTYSALSLTGVNNGLGQHVLDSQVQHCYGVGDCLVGARFLYGSGGFRDNADEGTHMYDLQVAEDSQVFQGTCATGCTAGSTSMKVTATSAPGSQGEGRFLIDKNPLDLITAGTLIGGLANARPHASASFSGTNFPVSTFFTLASAVLPQKTNMAPGAVTVPIATSGVYAGFSTNTASAPQSTGVACVNDAPAENSTATNFEMVNYTVSDGTDLQVTFRKPHAAGATLAIGGLCGYGVEQTVDTTNGIRQVFPIIGSPNATTIYYDGRQSSVLGIGGSTSRFMTYSANLASLVRSGNTVTVTTSGSFADLNGGSVTIAGVADSSFNGTFPITTTGSNQFTYTQTGANASSTGGTASILTGGYVMYPVAEVLSVNNPATNTVDGTLKLAPNTAPWAPGDAVEQPHFYIMQIGIDRTYETQYEPRPTSRQSAGVQYQGYVGPLLSGWTVANSAPASNYMGGGGTLGLPMSALAVEGAWTNGLEMQAGQNALLVHCTLQGCGRWDSGYNLVAMDRAGGAQDSIAYQPQNSTLNFNVGGASYGMSPTGMTAGTLMVTNLTATHINGATATAATAGVVQLGPAATTSTLANVASSGAAADVSGLAPSATLDTTNAANITSGTLSPARLPASIGACSTTVAFSTSPTFAVGCQQAVFHMPLTGNITGETFTGLAAGQRITLIFQVGSTAGYTVQWSANVHGGFGTSANAASPYYTQAGKYLVQQLVVDTDGVTLLNPGAINE